MLGARVPELVPGGYAGPLKAHRHAPPAFTHRLLDWFVAVTVPPLAFAGIAVLQGHYKTTAPRWLLWAVAVPLLCVGAAADLLKRKTDSAMVLVVVVLCATVVVNALLAPADAVVALVAGAAVGGALDSFRRGKLPKLLVALLVFVAAVAGTVCGMNTFLQHFDPAQQFQSLVTYVNIDPARDVGGAYTDSGEVYFKEGSRVDTQRAIAVMSKDVYCAAPIVREEAKSDADQSASVHPPPSGTVDWWAVGKNCCDPSGEQFTCGLAGLPPNMVPRAGLRQLYTFERHLYRLAVDEWASKFELPVNHPLFFEWVVDPLADVTNHVLAGWRQLVVYIEAFTVANFILATLAMSIVVELLGG